MTGFSFYSPWNSSKISSYNVFISFSVFFNYHSISIVFSHPSLSCSKSPSCYYFSQEDITFIRQTDSLPFSVFVLKWCVMPNWLGFSLSLLLWFIIFFMFQYFVKKVYRSEHESKNKTKRFWIIKNVLDYIQINHSRAL